MHYSIVLFMHAFVDIDYCANFVFRVHATGYSFCCWQFIDYKQFLLLKAFLYPKSQEEKKGKQVPYYQ